MLVPKHISWILPLLAATFWWAMLIAMMVLWFAGGRRQIGSHHYNQPRLIIYLSNVADTRYQPIFIVGAALMGIFFVATTCEETRLRLRKHLMPAFNRKTKASLFLMILWSLAASLFILLVSCFRNSRHHRLHMLFLGLFMLFVLLFCVTNTHLYIRLFRRYHKPWLLASAILKLIWAVIALALAIIFYVFMIRALHQGNGSMFWGWSAVCEWALCFWYGFLFVVMSVDLSIPRYDPDEISYHDAQTRDKSPVVYSM